MAISAVVTFRIRDGRHGDQVENFKAVKRLVERAGGTFRVDHPRSVRTLRCP